MKANVTERCHGKPCVMKVSRKRNITERGVTEMMCHGNVVEVAVDILANKILGFTLKVSSRNLNKKTLVL